MAFSQLLQNHMSNDMQAIWRRIDTVLSHQAPETSQLLQPGATEVAL